MSETNGPTIGLSIIVKDEEEVIERMLESVKPIIDHYTIVDTGSTDNTKKMINDFFEREGVSGEIIDHEFVDFEDARNKALKEAKDKTDFGFWIDADEELVLEEGFKLSSLKDALSKMDELQVPIVYNNTTYTRNHFYNNNLDYYWEGPCHEILMCDDPNRKAGVIKGMYILVKPEGASWTKQSQKDKYEGHAELIYDYITKKESNYKPRWVFYLAQSYRDAGNTEENNQKALKWYKERIRMKDHKESFYEEVYYSQLMVAHLCERLKYDSDVIFWEFLKCGEHDKKKGDHLPPAISHLHRMKCYETSYILSSHAMKEFHDKNPHPHRILFIDPSVYDHKIAELNAVSCYYTGRVEEGKKSFRKVLKALEKGKVTSQKEKDRIEKNKQFFIDEKVI